MVAFLVRSSHQAVKRVLVYWGRSALFDGGGVLTKYVS